MILKVTTKPVNSVYTNLALITNDNPMNDGYMKKIGMINNKQYSYYNRVYRETDRHHLYENSYYELPQPLFRRLQGPDSLALRQELKRVSWTEDAQLLWKESVAKWQRIDEITTGNEDVVLSTLAGAGIDPGDFQREFYPHQLQSLALHIELGFSCNWGQMRTGKTPPALIYAYHLLITKQVDLVVVVVPNSIKRVWYNEIPKDMPELMLSITCIIEGVKKKKEALWRDPRYKIKIVNYAGVRADIACIAEVLEDIRYLLILDESHNIKNPDAKQTIAIKSLKPDRLIVMSGTPVANKPEDVFEPISFVCPNLLGHSFNEFKNIFCKVGGYTGNNITGYREGALEDINKRMFGVSIRATRKSIGIAFGKTIEPRELEMSTPQRKAHDDANTQYRVELRSMDSVTAVTITSMLARLVRLQQISAGYLPQMLDDGSPSGDVLWLDDRDNAKQKWIDGFIFEYLKDIKKLVIFSKFIPVIKKLYERYKDKGATYVCGEVKPDERTYRVDELFRKDDATRILIINLDIASGFDMNPCQFAIFHERSWYFMPNEQAEDRITGINQVGNATIIPLVCKDSIDSRLEYKVLPRKRKYAQIVEGGGHNADVKDSLTITKQDLFDLVG